jgi:hypothetical protein
MNTACLQLPCPDGNLPENATVDEYGGVVTGRRLLEIPPDPVNTVTGFFRAKTWPLVRMAYALADEDTGSGRRLAAKRSGGGISSNKEKSGFAATSSDFLGEAPLQELQPCRSAMVGAAYSVVFYVVMFAAACKVVALCFAVSMFSVVKALAVDTPAFDSFRVTVIHKVESAYADPTKSLEAYKMDAEERRIARENGEEEEEDDSPVYKQVVRFVAALSC